MIRSEKAYAKINLHLDILGIRPDGYHEVETVMQTLSLCDDVEVSLNDSGDITCECNVEGVPSDDKNIAVRAARMFFEAVGSGSGAHIKIYKRIPMAAGLAGGSTDAAAVLRALNSLFDDKLSIDELCAIGSRLGADVPFCIVGGCRYSSGKGDILSSFSQIPENTVFVVACGGEGVSTPWAYGLMDEEFNRFEGYAPHGTQGLKTALESKTPEDFSKHIFNVFEAPVLSRRPVASQIKNIMQNAGALMAMMSGSGPSVFGVFASVDEAKRTEEEIISSGYFASVCYPVSI